MYFFVVGLAAHHPNFSCLWLLFMCEHTHASNTCTTKSCIFTLRECISFREKRNLRLLLSPTLWFALCVVHGKVQGSQRVVHIFFQTSELSTRRYCITKMHSHVFVCVVYSCVCISLLVSCIPSTPFVNVARTNIYSNMYG